jgi:hypothetical protein
MTNETNYTESDTGAAMCGTCDLWIDGIGANACVCCGTCDGDGRLLLDWNASMANGELRLPGLSRSAAVHAAGYDKVRP